MSGTGPSMRDLAQMINSVMGHKVLTEQQLEQIMRGAKRAHDQGGMNAVLAYLMKVTQADVDLKELKQFANNVKSNPDLGKDILQGKKGIPRKRK
ncbi:hypothetical protein [Lihuaxuella thermophila]|uniref:Uncharacterized protein n=1 Tax=Lihuaxuella thermophila TaxID=1173111 RepID=A0A1H8IBK2_9BACL|nr:hypothetical protein [Lihuaxuella thermophila]SEN66150.1 hypothetical protein SAMN05444955_11723 [Lihuaxuella thermophila]